MHPSAEISAEAFADTYGASGKVVVDVGGQNVNGTLRDSFEKRGMKYICVDMQEHPSVDIVVRPGEKFPFEDNSVDLVISTSCFEHDPCFWMTFREMTRIIKDDGYIYVNAPATGTYHCYPGDNWRFYSDAGQALAFWSGMQISTEKVYPVKVLETFHVLGDEWIDFVCVWGRTPTRETEIVVSEHISSNVGKMREYIHNHGSPTLNKFSGRQENYVRYS
jgi:SAM-dependent methyltransferase